MMKPRMSTVLALFLSLAFLVPGSPLPTAAQGPEPCGPPPKGPSAYGSLQGDAAPRDTVGEGCRVPQVRPASLPQGAGGPDEFGYTWQDSTHPTWIDAASQGTNTGLSGDDGTVLVDIGFPFKFYEQVWTQVYASTNGILVFGKADPGCLGGYCYGFPLPLPGNPNNVIAPFWEDLVVGSPANTGAIYTLQRGSAPDRSLVVEWHGVTRYYGGGPYTFEVILHENGDLIMQYLSMNGTVSCATSGIEDRLGADGLQYPYLVGNDLAVHFVRPAVSARVNASPLYQGQLTRRAETARFEVLVRNTGDLGSDTLDFTVSSTWPVQLYAAGGLSPLADSDGDGAVDTGPLAPGTSTQILAQVAAPAVAHVGDDNAAALTIRSSLNSSKSKTVWLQTAIPAPFAQVYRDGVDGAMSAYLVRPDQQFALKATRDNWNGQDMAVAETPTGFAYIWSRERQAGSVWVSELEYTLLDRSGSTVRSVTKLTNHTGATTSTSDLSPAVAVAPNGRIGVLWYRLLEKPASPKYNYNVWLAVLDPNGNVVLQPTNLTNNVQWGNLLPPTPNVPQFGDTTIAASEDSRFVLAWWRRVWQGTGQLDDVYYAVHDSAGNPVAGITRLTADTEGAVDAHWYPTLTALAGSRALVTWTRAGTFGDIYYAVLDSAGNVHKPVTALTTDQDKPYDSRPDAAQLAGGKVVVAWTSDEDPDGEMRYAILDGSYNRSAGPTALPNPAALIGNDRVSVAPAQGWAVLTWMDYYERLHRHLYYALLDGSGTVLTAPTIFRTSQAWGPYLHTSAEGNGNTSYSLGTPSAQVDLAVRAPAQANRPPGEQVWASASLSNNGLTTATSVVLTAELDSHLGYAGASPPPTSQVGNTLTWNVPDLGYLGGGAFVVYTTVPPAPLLVGYPLTWTVTSAGPEANPADNAATTNVMVARQVLLPLVLRRY